MRKLLSVRFHESVHLGSNGQTTSVLGSRVHRLEYLPEEELVLIQVLKGQPLRLIPLHGNIAEMVVDEPEEPEAPVLEIPPPPAPPRAAEMPAEIAAALSGNHKKK